MNELPIQFPCSFTADRVLALTAEDYRELLAQKTIPSPKDCALGKVRKEFRPEWPPGDTLCIAFDRSRSNYFFEFEPKVDLETFLENSRIVRISMQEGAFLSLICGVSIKELLPVCSKGSSDSSPIFRLEKLKGDDDAPLHDFVTDEAIQALAAGNTFCGMIACCGCGEPGCGAEYVWIENGACLFYLKIVSAGIVEVKLMPFKILA